MTKVDLNFFAFTYLTPIYPVLAFDLVFPPVVGSSIPYGKVDIEDLSRKSRLVHLMNMLLLQHLNKLILTLMAVVFPVADVHISKQCCMFI